MEAEIEAREAKETSKLALEIEEKKKATLAPDREKLIAYAVELSCLETPKLQTVEAKATLKKALELLSQAVVILKTNN